jgi:hypothetical protein
MAGQLTIDTLRAGSGVLATQNGMTGIAKAWVNFNGTGTVAIRDSFNVSSITDNGTGDYTINFTTAMPNVNYVVSGCIAYSAATGGSRIWVGINGTNNMLTTSVRVQSEAYNTSYDCDTVTIAINGD